VTVDFGTPCASAAITNTPCIPDIEVDKKVWDESSSSWVDQIRVPVGTDLLFKITVTNTGDCCTLTDIIVTDTLSLQLEYRDNTNYSEHYVSPDLRQIIWQFNQLLPGEAIEITFHAETVQLCYGWNKANVSGNCGSTTVYDEFLVTVKSVPEGGKPVLDITKQVRYDSGSDWVDSISTTIGKDLEFKITVDCTALNPVNGVEVTDNLPDHLVYNNDASRTPTSESDHQVVWDLGTMNPGDIIEITYHAVAVQDGLDDNIATVTSDELYHDQDYVLVQIVDFPLIQLIYPLGGEILSGIETIKWFAIDSGDPNLDIYLFYSADDGHTWRQINEALENDGEYELDTADYSDGEYMLKVEAVNNYNSVVADTSEPFTIDNGYAGIKISDVRIQDKNINSYKWVKDGDMVEITSGITGSYSLNREDITADLTGLGLGNNVIANSFDGFTATWMLSNVICNPRDGVINVKVTVKTDKVQTKSGTITSDNTAPKVQLTKPMNSLYLFDRRFIPLGRTIIIGKITIEATGLDSNGLDRIDFFIDDELKESITDNPFSWYMHAKLRGDHKITIKGFDPAGNEHSVTKQARFFSFF
jgi:uncharacterized repeat protein (TIGR01451 family)